MLSDDTRKKPENIVRGQIIEGQGDTCTSIRNGLCASFSTSTVKKDFASQSIFKGKQVIFLIRYGFLNAYMVSSLKPETDFAGSLRIGFLRPDGFQKLIISDLV